VGLSLGALLSYYVSSTTCADSAAEAPDAGRRARGLIPGVQAYTQHDFEAIEAAVQESPRGRWFLGEFARRNRAADTLMLLEAIRKLERGMAVSSAHQVSDELAAELQSLSDAIGRALSGEASEGEVQDAVEQLSRVKRQIDGLLADRSVAEAHPMTAESLKYFEGEEELFETASASSPARPFMVVADRPEQEPAARPMAEQPPASAPGGEPGDRIVFIRRASSKETSIPLADEPDDEVSAGQSQPAS
jgi:hypothetical protein